MLTLEVRSFSFKKSPLRSPFRDDCGAIDERSAEHGGGFVFDCRALPNPGRLAEFKVLTGLDASVAEYLARIPEVGEFIDLTSGLVIRSVRNYLTRTFDYLSVEYGCTGGQHRSVYCAQKFGEFIRASFEPSVVKLLVHHVELGREGL